MSKQIFAFSLSLVLLLGSPLYAGNPESIVQKLADTYGKYFVLGALKQYRDPNVTIEINGELRETIGEPDLSYVTPRSLLADIEKAGVTLEGFEKSLKIRQAMAKRQGGEPLEAHELNQSRSETLAQRMKIVQELKQLEEQRSKKFLTIDDSRPQTPVQVSRKLAPKQAQTQATRNTTQGLSFETIRQNMETMTDIAWDDYTASLKGEKVTWEGWVSDVKKQWFGGYKLLIDMDKPGTVSVQDVYIHDLSKEFAAKWSKDEGIRFTGTIKSVNSVLGSCAVTIELGT